MVKARVILLVISALVIAAGLIAGASLRGSPAAAPRQVAPTPRESAMELEAPEAGDALRNLRDEVAREREERLALAREVASLRAELSQISAPPEEGAPLTAFEPPEAEPLALDTPPVGAAPPPFFDEEQLAGYPLSPSELTGLRERYEEAELARMELRDRAAREGWLGRPRWRRATEALEDDFRADVGDDDYDLMLYAAGRDNRVRVNHVLHNSAAMRAGIQSGDIIVAYNGRRIFDVPDLQNATRGVRVGQPVRVEATRDGRNMVFSVEGGTMGTHLGALSQAPPFR